MQFTRVKSIYFCKVIFFFKLDFFKARAGAPLARLWKWLQNCRLHHAAIGESVMLELVPVPKRQEQIHRPITDWIVIVLPITRANSPRELHTRVSPVVQERAGRAVILDRVTGGDFWPEIVVIPKVGRAFHVHPADKNVCVRHPDVVGREPEPHVACRAKGQREIDDLCIEIGDPAYVEVVDRKSVV